MAEKKTCFEMAKDYYPRLWDKTRIDTLYENNKLTKDEYDKIIGNKC